MLNTLPITLIISTIMGFLAGIGVGGGSILILWLTLILGMEYGQARIINLLFFIPSAIIASFFRFKQGNINLPKILPGIICGCVASFLCAKFCGRADSSILKKLFGGLLLLTGIRELLYRPRKAK